MEGRNWPERLDANSVTGERYRAVLSRSISIFIVHINFVFLRSQSKIMAT